MLNFIKKILSKKVKTASDDDAIKTVLASQKTFSLQNRDIDYLSQRYEIGELLGKGGMGIVFRVRHKKLQQDFAIKVLSNPEIEKRFLNEARLASKLRSRYVVSVYDFDFLPKKGSGLPFIVMDFIKGTSLDKLIAEQKQLREKSLIRFMKHTAYAMISASRFSIVHRDIKPANLLIDESNNLKVTDFGIARTDLSDERLTHAGDIFGTPHYMAPEQAESSRDADIRSDIYSFGATFYEAATGRPPFKGDTFVSIIMKHKNEPVVLPKDLCPSLSRQLSSLIGRCLEKSPMDRYQSFDEIRAVLESLPDNIGKEKEVSVKDHGSGLDNDTTRVVVPVKTNSVKADGSGEKAETMPADLTPAKTEIPEALSEGEKETVKADGSGEKAEIPEALSEEEYPVRADSANADARPVKTEIPDAVSESGNQNLVETKKPCTDDEKYVSETVPEKTDPEKEGRSVIKIHTDTFERLKNKKQNSLSREEKEQSPAETDSEKDQTLVKIHTNTFNRLKSKKRDTEKPLTEKEKEKTGGIDVQVKVNPKLQELFEKQKTPDADSEKTELKEEPAEAVKVDIKVNKELINRISKKR